MRSTTNSVTLQYRDRPRRNGASRQAGCISESAEAASPSSETWGAPDSLTDADPPLASTPAPPPIRPSDRPEAIARFKHLTEAVLPALAREHRWPIRLDHCFKRICLDHAFAGIWYHHLPRPAERHLNGAPLARAIQCAEAIAAEGLSTLTLRNTESLRFRGKLRQPEP